MPIHSESDKFTVSVLACLEANVGFIDSPGAAKALAGKRALHDI